jgi:hypothetical protein
MRTQIVEGRLRATRNRRIPQSLILETILEQVHRVCKNNNVPFELRRDLWQAAALLQTGSSKSDTYENDLVKLLFNATAIANVADNAASSPLTQLAVALHTADPGEAGTQSTSETSYTGYARVNVNRNSGGWTVTGNSASPAAVIEFGECTVGTPTLTHGSVGRTGGGATEIFYSGAITPNIAVVVGTIPRIGTTSTFTED